MAGKPHIMLVEARFYPAISDELAKGAIGALAAAGATHERFAVPGVFEIPAAIQMAIRARSFSTLTQRFDGYVALGCVIRGETTHYDYVCGESARGLMDLAIYKKLAIGYGIVTVDNIEQARARAFTNRGDKGGDAAHACLAMVALRRRWKKS
jgi:6,7-dimethyl-8-ribityllumazine synthase